MVVGFVPQIPQMAVIGTFGTRIRTDQADVHGFFLFLNTVPKTKVGT